MSKLKLNYGKDSNSVYHWNRYLELRDTIMIHPFLIPSLNVNLISLSELINRQREKDRNFGSNYGGTRVI